jgi:hypothetical protein
MHAIECMFGDELFRFVDPAGTVREFNASEMMRKVLDGRVKVTVMKTDITEPLYIHMRDDHGVEMDHLPRITGQKMQVPIFIANFPAGYGGNDSGIDQPVVFDGAHRIVKAWLSGVRELTCIVFQPKDWEPILVEGIGETFDLQDVVNKLGYIPKAFTDPT